MRATPEKASNPARTSASSVAADLQADAERFLRSMNHTWPGPIGANQWLGEIAKVVRRTSKTQHLRAVALAYAVSLQLAGSPQREAMLKSLETTLGRKRSARTRSLHLVVERFIAYGADTPAEKTAARKLYSRDVRAIEHLKASSVRPSQVELLARDKGEGLDRWARCVAEPRPARRMVPSKPSISAKQEAYERGLRHGIVITTTKPDGTRVGRKRASITGVLKSEVADAMKGLKAIGDSDT